MKILMIECTAEELAANRTVMDSVVNALDNFANKMFGVQKIDWSKVNLNEDEGDEENESDITE